MQAKYILLLFFIGMVISSTIIVADRYNLFDEPEQITYPVITEKTVSMFAVKELNCPFDADVCDDNSNVRIFGSIWFHNLSLQLNLTSLTFGEPFYISYGALNTNFSLNGTDTLTSQSIMITETGIYNFEFFYTDTLSLRLNLQTDASAEVAYLLTDYGPTAYSRQPQNASYSFYGFLIAIIIIRRSRKYRKK